MALIAVLIAIWLAILAWRRWRERRPDWRPLALAAGGGAVLGLGLLLIDHEAQKMASRLATPLGVAWLLLFAALLDAWRQRAWLSAVLSTLAWLLLSLGGNNWVAAWLLADLEREVPPPAATHWDAIVLLGGGTDLATDGTPQLGTSGDRLRVAARLLAEGRAPLLIATGSDLFQGERDLGAEALAIIGGWGLDPDRLLAVPGPVNTRQEIERVHEIAARNGWRRVALVSSAWHLPRALRLAERLELAADGIPADHRGRPPPASPVYLVPGGQALQLTQLWCTERLGRLVGR